MNSRRKIELTGFFSALLTCSSTAMADNSWGRYKWEPSSIPFTLELGDNLNSGWDGYLSLVSADWSASTRLDTTVVPGSTDSASCSPEAGNVQVCNYNYGNNGWLGVAQIYTRGHTIIAGLAKLNDYYHGAPPYNSSAWRRLVMCQEIAHTFGLDHQDEIFDNPNLGTCMDYTDDPDGTIRNNGLSNEYPNQHDFDQLEIIYAVDDGSGGDGGGGDKPCNPRSPRCNPASAGDHPRWGRLVSGHGALEVFERNLGRDNRVITFVTWTLESAASHEH